jgi:hypothetical protein
MGTNGGRETGACTYSVPGSWPNLILVARLNEAGFASGDVNQPDDQLASEPNMTIHRLQLMKKLDKL